MGVKRVMRVALVWGFAVGCVATLRAWMTAEEVEAALRRGEVPEQLLGARSVEVPDPETLPPEMVVGTAEREALFGRGVARGGLSASVSLPAKFDLRDEGAVTATRNQNPWGTCWMFASMSSFESCLLKMYGEKADFSEWNCLMRGRSDDWDILQSGGSANDAERLMNQLFGPPLEVQDKYQTTRPSPMTHKPLPAARQLERVVYLYPPYDSVTKQYDTFDADYVRQIKEHLYTYGAVTTAYYHDKAYFNATYTAYYKASGNDGTNHVVTIIGWDDTYAKENFATTPSRNGAWLVKNSWGTWCDYFYISYDDVSVNRYGSVAQFWPMDPACAKDVNRIYQHDEGVWKCWFSFTRQSQCSMASLFTAQSTETLYYIICVSQQTDGVPIDYTLSIYGNPEAGKPSTGTCLATQSGTLTKKGTQRLALETPVRLTKGMRFSIVLSLSSANSNGEAIRCAHNDDVQTTGCTYYALTYTPTASTNWSDSAVVYNSAYGNLSLRAVTGPAASGHSSLMDWLKAAGYARAGAVASLAATATASGVIDYDAALVEMAATTKTESGLTPWECYLAGTLPDEPLRLIPRLTFDEAGEPVLSPDPELVGRTYTLYSKAALEDAWSTDEELSGKHFFKYRVSWPAAE